MRLQLAALLLATTLPIAIPATAATAAQAPKSEKLNGRKVAAEVKRLLNEQYVLPDLRPKFDAVLSKAIAGGRYDVSDPEELVNRLNADLDSVTPDKHLSVAYDPETSRQLAAAQPTQGDEDAPPSANEIAAANRLNHGLAQMKLLPGNIRYLETTGFIWAGQSTEKAYDTAMEFLSQGDAVIIDMRRNGGGSPDAVRYLISHFLDANKPLMTFYMGSKGVATTAAMPTTNAPRMVGKPLYVLTSGGSASAAEEFIGHVAGYKLGELIGQPSAGAGFRNEFFGLPDGLIISISVGQAVLASTGKGWEGVGFKPDTVTELDKALDVAVVHALRKIAETAPPGRAKSLQAIAAVSNAKLYPVKTALPIAAYAGAFGERSLSADGNGLRYQRAGGPPLSLIAVGPNQFAFDDDPETTVSFTVDGDKASVLHLVRSDGSTVDADRNP